jgi:hypothetical protein
MKQLLVVAVLAVLAIAVGAYAAPVARPDVPQARITMAQDQQAPTPSVKDQAAFIAFQKFATDHKLAGLGRFHVDEDGKIVSFDLGLATVDEDGQPADLKWVVYGYPTVDEAAKQIESDFTKYPDGNPDGTTYKAPNSSEKKA